MGRLKTRDLMLMCNGILGLVSNKTTQIIAKNFNQFTA